MYDAIMAETIRVAGFDGDEIEAYLARPLVPGPVGGVVVIHHMPGYDEATKEITRRFAAEGYAAICPNLYWRDAPGAAPDDAAATARAAGGVPDERLVGDVEGAVRHLRSLTCANGKVGIIGYCSGGRQAFLTACSLDIDAAVDCYGAWVMASPPEDFPLPITPVAHLAPQLRCPLLGLFGADDKRPAPSETEALERVLTEHGKTFAFHTFEQAGHAFFASDRPSYRPAAAVAGWERILTWFGDHLST